MKRYKYIGSFGNGKINFTISVQANSFIEAFFLLTAKAIEEGKFYQLNEIEDEIGHKTKINDIMLMNIFLD
jgi:hypothetical protein